MLPRKIFNFRSLEWPFPAISRRNTPKPAKGSIKKLDTFLEKNFVTF
jgi:hypothetical protein